MNKKYIGIIKCLIYIFGYLLCFVGCQYLLTKIFKNDMIIRIINYIVMLILLFILVKKNNKLDLLKLNKDNLKKSLKVGFFILLLSALFILLNFVFADSNAYHSIFYIIYWIIIFIFGTALTEELLCRGLLLNTLYDYYGRNSRKKVIIFCIFTGILFGFSHVVNALSGSFNVGQVLFTISLGMVFGAIYSRSNSLWGVVLLHGIWDISLSFEQILFITDVSTQTSNLSIINQILSIMPMLIIFIIYFMVLVRKSKINECLK